MSRHTHIVSRMYGPPLSPAPAGVRQAEAQFTPYQEIALFPDGTVMFKRNLPQPDGLNNAAGWPVSANTGLVRW